MAQNSPIEWTEQTWNPTKGCTIKSPGCAKCYAMKMARRLEAMGQVDYAGTTKVVNGHPVWTGKINLASETTLLQPLKRKKPTTYFVNSMSDLFHEDMPIEHIDRTFAIMALTLQHIYQILTKRSAEMRAYFADENSVRRVMAIATEILAKRRDIDIRSVSWDYPPWPLPNVWLGVSTERQQEADERIPLLLDTPAAVRFISAEPLLGPIDLSRLCIMPQKPGSIRAGIHLNALAGRYCESGMPYLGDWDVNGPCPPASDERRLDLVIVGGESGPGARPMHPEWARSLRDKCSDAAVPFFFKQWGAWLPGTQFDATHIAADPNPEQSRFDCMDWDGERYEPSAGGWCDDLDEHAVFRVGKKRAGRALDGVEHNAMPHRGQPV